MGYPSRSSRETIGLISWQGPHQVAVKSSTTPSRLPLHPNNDTKRSLSGTMRGLHADVVKLVPDGLQYLQSTSPNCTYRTLLRRIEGASTSRAARSQSAVSSRKSSEG